MERLEEQKSLSHIIKGIHQDLRKRTKEVGADKAWKSHLADKDKLKLYAKVMRELSECHWKRKNSCEDNRIQWVINYSEFYFQEAQLKNFRVKDLKVMDRLRTEEIKLDPIKNLEALRPVVNLKVLDVGSNGNFFKKHKRFDITAIDIAPSCDDCFFCDFTNVTIGEKIHIKSKAIQHLPRNFYDIVLFCLLLEYLPTSEMRITCCKKAYQVLKTEGILVIITPDSSSQHRNAKQIKNWKWTLAMMGFRRIKVEKLKNLTCMVFRKSLCSHISIRWAEQYKEDYMEYKLEIPQDRKLIMDEENSNKETPQDITKFIYDTEVMNLEMPCDY